jgi:hypothetical protein
MSAPLRCRFQALNCLSRATYFFSRFSRLGIFCFMPVGTYGFAGHFLNSTPLFVKLIPAAASSVIKTNNVDSWGKLIQQASYFVGLVQF